MKRPLRLTTLLFFLALIFISATTINNFFLPGSQPGQSGNLETPDRCDNCHGGYDQTVEPAFNWRGGMMSQAARDPLFWACLDIAEQDAPGSGDLCIRCHSPSGWLSGRSTPTNGSALNKDDMQGVHCDFCHKLVKPTLPTSNPFPNDTYYTANTWPADQAYLAFISPNIPPASANGMFIADRNNAKRGPYSDATGRHQMFYSPFHRESAICGTCHDVSNPAFTRPDIHTEEYAFNGGDIQATNFENKYLFPVERTYSEWLISAWNKPSNQGGKTCQTCHMRPVTGHGAKMKDAPLRTDLALHDMTGGNTFIPKLIKHLFADDNAVDQAALDAGIERARAQLREAADLELTVENNVATVKVVNKTGHKLPSGYPEGRRIWVNLKAFDNEGNLVFESGAYDNNTALLNTDGTKIYEIKPGFSEAWAATLEMDAGPSFHFAINNKIYFDNRIPPMGATNAKLIEIQSPVIGATYADGQNFDITEFSLPVGVDRVEAKLFYQTLSKEYVEFLRNENTTTTRGQELYDLWVMFEKSPPELMNEAIWSDVDDPEEPEDPGVVEMFVEDFVVTRVTINGGRTRADASLTVKANGIPLKGATVFATWTYGTQSGTVSAVTDGNGKVVLSSQGIKNATGLWCFTINNVTFPNYVFNNAGVSACTGGQKNSLAFELPDRENTLVIYPNPVREMAHISYYLNEPGRIIIEVFNGSGIRVAEMTERSAPAGHNTLHWNPAGLSHGIYYVRMTTPKGVLRQTIVVR
jgi:hypothetical protein